MLKNIEIHGRKVIVPREAIADFNAQWPCSELRTDRHYWFEFDADMNLVDSDVPEQDDGSAASAMAEDCKNLLFNGIEETWMLGHMGWKDFLDTLPESDG